MKQRIHIIFRVNTILLIFFGYFIFTSPVNAQINPSWANPSIIPGLRDTGFNPVLIADGEGTIHIFHSQPIAGRLSIMYARWSYQNGWSHLVDVITSPRGDARIQDALLDEDGWIHLIFWGGDEFGADMFYTKAPAIKADKSTAWEYPMLIGDKALDPSTAGLSITPDKDIIVVYSSNLRGNGLYSVQSPDAGNTWETPKPLFIAYRNQLWPSGLQKYTDIDGQIFATWAVADDTGNGQAVYFSRFNPQTKQWNSPIIIAKAIGFEADTPAIIKYNNELVLIYHNNNPTTRWMRTSSDDGQSWSQPTRLFEQVGSNGAASLVIDSSNTLHMFFGNRIGTPAIHGAWHSQWIGKQWSTPEAIVSGPQIVVGPNGEEGFDPSFLRAVVSRGNLLFVIWRHDPRAGPTNIWYTYQTLDTPELQVTPLPTIVTGTSTPAYTPTEIQPATGTPQLETTATYTPSDTEISSEVDSQQPSIIPNANILLGIVPIILLILLVVTAQRRNK